MFVRKVTFQTGVYFWETRMNRARRETRLWHPTERVTRREREFFIENLLVRIHRCFWWTGFAPWEFEFPFPGSLVSRVTKTFRYLLRRNPPHVSTRKEWNNRSG